MWSLLYFYGGWEGGKAQIWGHSVPCMAMCLVWGAALPLGLSRKFVKTDVCANAILGTFYAYKCEHVKYTIHGCQIQGRW